MILKTKSAFLVQLFIAIFLIIASYNNSYAQLTVADTMAKNELAQFLAGPGVTISNVFLNCAPGAFGTFNASNSNIPLEEGVLLTTGSIVNAVGPNDEVGATTDNLGFGDSDLDPLIFPFFTNDACVFEFDITVDADSIAFEYVFASEEYPEFVCDVFNDVFAFFLSGPGIPTPVNLALIPFTNTPVSINTVNGGGVPFPAVPCIQTNTGFYIANGDGLSLPQSIDPTVTQYDGFTKSFTASRGGLQACQTYRLKLAIADGADFQFDSGVFLKAKSIRSFGVSLSTSTSGGTGVTDAIEGCVNGFFNFNLSRNLTDTLVTHFEIVGTAQNGVDYDLIADSVVFTPGQTNVNISIIPNDDGLNEGTESVTLLLFNSCSPNPVDSATILIQDSLVMTFNLSDDSICLGDTVSIRSSGAATYDWSPGGTLSVTDSSRLQAWPAQSTTYTVIGTASTCQSQEKVTIFVSEATISASAAPADTVCLGDTVTLTANVSANEAPFSYQWLPTGSLIEENAAVVRAVPSGTVVYSVSATAASGCVYEAQTSVTALSFQLETAFTDTAIDQLDTVRLSASVNNIIDGLSFFWKPNESINDINSLTPVVAPLDTLLYTIVATSGSCTDSASTLVNVREIPNLWAIPEAFSPNGDGLNDVFEIQTVGLLEVSEFKVFNRWGDLIHDQLSGWNGSFEGKDQPAGTYVFLVKLSHPIVEDQLLQGAVLLVR